HRVARTSGNPYGMIQLEDFSGEVTVMFMGRAYQEFSESLMPDTIAAVRARVSVRDDGVNLHAFTLTNPDVGAETDTGPLVISVRARRATATTITALGEVLGRHSGANEVRLRLVKDDAVRLFELPQPVAVTPDLYGELKALLGPGCLA